NFDRRHVISMSWLYAPAVRFSNLAAKHLLEHWSLGVFHTIQSGAPLSFAMGTDVALNGTGQGQRAQLVNGATYSDIKREHKGRNDEIYLFFNPAVFVS